MRGLRGTSVLKKKRNDLFLNFYRFVMMSAGEKELDYHMSLMADNQINAIVTYEWQEPWGA